MIDNICWAFVPSEYACMTSVARLLIPSWSPPLANTPVVVVSMLAGESRSTLVGALDVLAKPVDRSTLTQVLQTIRTTPGRVLVVEDDPDTRRLLAELLEDDGWQVAEADNGREGMSALQSFVPDVVLLDLMMPVMDGAEFLVWLRAQQTFNTLPVVIVTAKDLSVEERASLSARAATIMPEGSKLKRELHEVIATLFDLDSHRTESPEDAS